MNRKGFTLIELLVVIAIITILASFLLPAVMGAKRSALKKYCANNLRQIGQSLALYEDKYKEYPPATGNTVFRILLTSRQIAQEENLICKVRTGASIYNSYLGPNDVLGELVESDQPIGSDAQGNHGQPSDANVLLFDSSVHTSPDERTIFNGRIIYLNYLQL